MVYTEVFITMSFVLGLVSAEYILKPKKVDRLREFLAFIISISVSFLILSRTYYIVGNSEKFLYIYFFLLGFVSTVISRILTFSFGFHIKKKRKKVSLENHLERKYVRIILELKKLEMTDEKILEICENVGVNKRFTKKVLKIIRDFS